VNKPDSTAGAPIAAVPDGLGDRGLASEIISGAAPEDFNRLLFDANPLPLWVYDLETLRFLAVNEVALEKYGYTHEEFLGMSILDIRPAEDRGAVNASVRLTPTQTFSSGVWRHRLRDRSQIYVEITSHEVTFRGRPARLVCPIDVTQRFRAEGALLEREAGLRHAQSVARLAHVILIQGGLFESWSDSLPALTGVGNDQLPTNQQAWCEQLVHIEDRERVCESMSDAMPTNAGIELAYRLCRPDGSTIFIKQLIEPLNEWIGEDRKRWFSTLQDVTAQSEAQAQVIRLNEELESRVRSRTDELEATNRFLIAARVEAERANQAKSVFLGNMSHELRTPLNAILGFGQLLTGETAQQPEQVERYSGTIVQAGQHLLSLINGLLDLASIEADKLDVHLEPVALNDLFAECGTMLGPLALKRSIDIRVDISADTVLADRMRLKQVLLNLWSNAIKYSAEHGIVRVRSYALSSQRVRIEINDSGVGLDGAQLSGLFLAFNRLGQEKGPTEGSGIGLFLAKRLVELMGGTIGADSAKDVGSTFYVDLPQAGLPVGPPLGLPTMTYSGVLAQGDPLQGTVLCIEDDLQCLALVREVLATRPGLQLLSAVNGKLGVAMARTHRPDIILMDNNMPEMSGHEARALLLQEPGLSSIPVIALSASPLTARPAGSRNTEFFRCLSKPLDIDRLLEAIDAAWAVRSGSVSPS
jgi:PAS domain S-box-containing protein